MLTVTAFRRCGRSRARLVPELALELYANSVKWWWASQYLSRSLYKCLTFRLKKWVTQFTCYEILQTNIYILLFYVTEAKVIKLVINGLKLLKSKEWCLHWKYSESWWDLMYRFLWYLIESFEFRIALCNVKNAKGVL